MKPELEKYITIGITKDGKCGVYVTPQLDAATTFQLLGTLTKHLLDVFTAVAEHAIDEDKLTLKELDAAHKGIRESLYDTVDTLTSNVLNSYYPDAPRLSIEDEAILELTNKKIEERFNALSDEEKAAFATTYSRIKDEIFKKTQEDTDESTSESSTD